MTGMPPITRLNEDLRKILRCPVTGQPLRQEGAELVTTGPGSAGETLRYPIEEGIPVLLPAERRDAVGSD